MPITNKNSELINKLFILTNSICTHEKGINIKKCLEDIIKIVTPLNLPNGDFLIGLIKYFSVIPPFDYKTVNDDNYNQIDTINFIIRNEKSKYTSLVKINELPCFGKFHNGGVYDENYYKQMFPYGGFFNYTFIQSNDIDTINVKRKKAVADYYAGKTDVYPK